MEAADTDTGSARLRAAAAIRLLLTGGCGEEPFVAASFGLELQRGRLGLPVAADAGQGERRADTGRGVDSSRSVDTVPNLK
jgi:hypothetical protein